MLKRSRSLSRLIIAALAAGGATGAPALAEVTLTAQEVGNDVIISGGGTLDTSLWADVGSVLGTPALQADTTFLIGPLPGDMDNVDVYMTPVNFDGPATIGPGMTFNLAESGSGDSVGLWIDEYIALYVPVDYDSGDPIVGSESVFENDSFTSLGLSKGEYTWTWDTADGSGDSFTIRIIPAPGSLALMGLAGLAGRQRRRT